MTEAAAAARPCAGGLAAARHAAWRPPRDRARRHRAAPARAPGKTTVATGLHRRAGRARPAPDGLQGRPRLHRPQLPRAGDRAARAQPRRLPLRPGAASRRSCATAAPGPTSPSSRASWAFRRRLGPRRAGLHRARRQAAATRPSSSSLDAARDGALGGGDRPRLPHVRPRRRRRGRDPQPRRLRRATRSCCARRSSRSACPCSARCAATTRSIAPERHLGLVPVAEREPRARAALDALGAAVEARSRPRRARAPGRAAAPDDARRPPGSPTPRRRPRRARIADRPRPGVLLPLRGEPRAAARPPAPSSSPFDPLADEALPRAPARWSSPAASPRSSARSWRPTRRCAPRSPPSRARPADPRRVRRPAVPRARARRARDVRRAPDRGRT